MDTVVFHWINTGWSHPVLDWVMSGLNLLGSRWTALGVCVGFVVVGSRRTRVWGMLGIMALGISLTLVEILKHIVLRSRPWVVLPGVRLLEAAQGPDLSFPSGHAAAAFALATLVALRFPRTILPAFLLATGVALARIYLGVHFPSDVLAGAVLGAVPTWFVGRWALRRFPHRLGTGDHG